MRHTVAVLAVPPIVAFDTAIPDLVFSRVRVAGTRPYRVIACTSNPGVVAGGTDFQVVVNRGLDELAKADTVVVPGVHSHVRPDERVLDALRKAVADGKRVLSICTGAFVLAHAGVLDGRRATTHWHSTDELATRFPAVDVCPDVLYVDDGQVLTSAGLAAGIDLCLHVVRADHGAAVANAVARRIVVSPVRPGGQAQFIPSPLPPDRDSSLAATRAWAHARLDQPLTLTDLAREANVSVRTLSRRFREETGLSPLQWLLHQRVERARELLEASDLPIEQVARRSGLGTPDSLRQHLTRRVGLTPTAYRATFSRLPN